MEENEVIQLLRYYRHGVMNQLQLIQGYMSMDKPEKVREKIATYNAYLHDEQNLMNMNAPSFTLWLLFFNDRQPSMRLSYEIKTSNMHLTNVDAILTTQCENVFTYLSDHLPASEYYEGHFILDTDKNDTLIKAAFYLSGDFSTLDFGNVEQSPGISQLQIKKTDKGMQCEFLVPLHNEVD